MYRILKGQQGMINMIDDVLVFGRNREEHNKRLSKVLGRLLRAGLTLNNVITDRGRQRVVYESDWRYVPTTREILTLHRNRLPTAGSAPQKEENRMSSNGQCSEVKAGTALQWAIVAHLGCYGSDLSRMSCV